MKRKVVSVILATAMVASMVAGCGGSNNALQTKKLVYVFTSSPITS